MLNFYGLPASRRLKQNHQFRCVLAHNNKTVSRYFVVYQKENQLSHARLGIVVSKRCSKLATVRNRIKRLIREWFRRQTTLASSDIVLVARPPTAQATNKDINLCLRQLGQRLIES